MAAEQVKQAYDLNIPQLLERLGGTTRIGPIEVNSDALQIEKLPNGIFDVEHREATNTGELLRIHGGDGFMAVKSFLNKDHSYLDFRKPWKSIWSLGAEFQAVAKGQMSWPEEDRTHLGVVGVVDLGDGKVELTSLSQVDGDSVEPGLLMRWLPHEDGLMNILLTDPEHFERLLPQAIQAIYDNQTPLNSNDALRYGDASAVYDWIDKGNLNNLRKSNDPQIQRNAVDFWVGFSDFVTRYGSALNQRARQGGAIVRGNGDTKPLNAFRVGERVAYIDPITLLLRVGEGQGDFILAPWSLHDRVSELAYFTVYIRVLEKLAERRDGVVGSDREQMRDLRQVAIGHYNNVFGEDASVGKLSALHLLYEAGYGSVEYELNLRKAQGMEFGQERMQTESFAWGLKEVMLESIQEAHEVAQESRLEKGLL